MEKLRSVGADEVTSGSKAADGSLQLLSLILGHHAELELTDSQLGALSRLYWGAHGSNGPSVDAISQHLSRDQFHRALVWFAESAAASPEPTQAVHPVDELVAASLEKRTKDKDLVELEVAAKAAERMIGWARTFGFFVAIPAGLILIIATLFGLSKVEDVRSAADRVDARVREAEVKLDTAVAEAQRASDRASRILASANDQIAVLETRLANQAQQLSTLDQKVAKIAESLSFGQSEELSKNLRESLTQTAAAFLNYFEKLGYTPKTPSINVNTKLNVPGALSYYDPGTNTIFVLPSIVADRFVMLHEYSHHILYSSLSFNALTGEHRAPASLVPIEFGLADYFPASFLNDPHLGAQAARSLKYDKPYLSNLDNSDRVSTLVISDYTLRNSLENAWGGLFWEIRQKLTQPAADKLLYDTWRAQPSESNNLVGRRFVANLLSKAQSQLGKNAKSTVQEILIRRGLKPSDFTNPPLD